jgi:hypothetical protein
MQRLLQRSLGKFKIRYARGRCYTEFEGQKNAGRYRVVWENTDSVFVVFPEQSGRESGQLIRFLSENEYWVNAGRNIEYFRRVRAPNTSPERSRER